MGAIRHTFTKGEILRKKKLIEKLQDKKSNPSVFEFPFILTWTNSGPEEEYPAQILVAVPKRNFKKATARNRVKRQVKEAYRLQKHNLYNFLEQKNMKVALMVIFVGKGNYTSAYLAEKLGLLLSKFMVHVEENP